ncbi:MAG: multidrug effflux MFS transporter [Bacteroidota bacterium]
MSTVVAPPSKPHISELEFIALMAFLMSNVALSIDAILPALTQIGESLSRADDGRLQLVVTMIFLGLGLGELVFGTLSDSIGRKPIVFAGVALFMLASLVCVTANSLEGLLLGRVLQGIGLSAPRTVSMAIIRDVHSGDKMARIMSFIGTIFILIPMIAPILGQFILKAFNWQAIFYFQLIFISVTVGWFGLRQRETLLPERRIPFSKTLFIDGFKEFLRFRNTLIYTFVAGVIEGSFILYLSSSKYIFQDQYQMVDEFPYIFAALAFAFGLATFFNGSLVTRIGMRKLVDRALYGFILSPLLYLLLFFSSSNPSLVIVMAFLAMQFLCLGFIFGNLSALAMQPIGHIAGIGAALFSFTTMSTAVVLAIVMGQFIADTALPLFISFFSTGLCAFLLLRWRKED